jgi:hypothetical protein
MFPGETVFRGTFIFNWDVSGGNCDSWNLNVVRKTGPVPKRTGPYRKGQMQFLFQPAPGSEEIFYARDQAVLYPGKGVKQPEGSPGCKGKCYHWRNF